MFSNRKSVNDRDLAYCPIVRDHPLVGIIDKRVCDILKRSEEFSIVSD